MIGFTYHSTYITPFIYHSTHITPPSRWQCLVLNVTAHISHRHHGDNDWFYISQHTYHTFYISQHTYHTAVTVTMSGIKCHSTPITPPSRRQWLVLYITAHISHLYISQYTYHTVITVTMTGFIYHSTHITPPSRWQWLVWYVTAHISHHRHGDNVWYYLS